MSSVLTDDAALTGPTRRTIAVDSIGQVRSGAEHVVAGTHDQQVGAELVDLRQDVGPARGRDAEHRDDRGDADRDADRGQRRPSLATA